MLFFLHLAAVVLAAAALWSMRHEFRETAATRRQWAAGPALAAAAAVLLLIASPGKRFELWLAAIAGGIALGAFAGWLLKVNQDFGLLLMRVPRAWDGVGAAGLLLALAVVRFVSSSLIGRQSGGFGVLGAAAAFLGAYIAMRYVMVRFYKAPRSIHLDMIEGRNPKRTMVN